MHQLELPRVAREQRWVDCRPRSALVQTRKTPGILWEPGKTRGDRKYEISSTWGSQGGGGHLRLPPPPSPQDAVLWSWGAPKRLARASEIIE